MAPRARMRIAILPADRSRYARITQPAMSEFMTSSDPSPNKTTMGRLYVIATVHLDTQWRWTIQDTIRDFIPATLQRNFDLLERYPFFVVSFEGAFRYQLMKEYYPLEFERLRQWIADGRWRLAGSMLDAPDVNAVAPESLIRQVLYGNGFFQEEFGLRSRDIFLPDCFGYGWALPSVAAHCGLIGFSGQKFGRWMAPAKIPFDVGVWRGPDDEEIIAAIRPEGYGESLREDLSLAARFRDRLERTGRQSDAYVGIKYVGVGDRGGGLDEESMQWLDRSIHGEGPVQVVVNGSDQIFQDLQPRQVAKLPRHRDELLLPTHGTGCLSSQAALKRWNRRNELLADAAERAAVMADSLGLVPYPSELLKQAWTRFLWHQMHDDLTGTSIPAAYRFTDNDQLLSLNQFSSVVTHSVGAIANRMDTRGQGQAIAVFNPLSIERQDVVTVDLPQGSNPPEQVLVIGPDGREVPSQVVGDGGGETHSILFLARVPPVGIQIYDLRLGGIPTTDETALEISAATLANHRYQVEIDGQGDVRSVFDQLTRRELLASPIRWQLIRDRSSKWPAWEILYEDLLEQDPPQVGGTPQIRILENGPVRVGLEIVRQSRRSTFRQILRLAAGEAGDRFEVFNDVWWQTRGRLLKARFSLAAANPVAHYDLGLGVIERGNSTREKYEVPAQQWAALRAADGSSGVSILNDCKYGWDKPDDQTLRMTLLRSPRVIRKFRHQGWQDHGRHRFTYALCGDTDGWEPAESTWQAARLNQPLMAFATPSHQGSLGKELSFLQASSPQVALQALKKAETGDRWIARLRELSGRPASAFSVQVPDTLRPAVEVNGMEDEIGQVSVHGHRFETSLGSFGMRTFAIERTVPDNVPTSPPTRPLELPFDVVATRPQGKADPKGFDGAGHSIPSELWPTRLSFGGIDFVLGAANQVNALSCRGQSLPLNPGSHDRLDLLAATTDGPVSTSLHFEDSHAALEVGYYSGFLGRRPDPRRRLIFGSAETKVTLGDRHAVAWVGTHRHGPKGEDEPYVFCYLFRYSVALQADCHTIRLPVAPRIHIFAATLTSEGFTDTVPAHALYD